MSFPPDAAQELRQIIARANETIRESGQRAEQLRNSDPQMAAYHRGEIAGLSVVKNSLTFFGQHYGVIP